MCGEVPKGHYKIDLTIHLTANQTTVTIPLPRKFEWTKEMWVNEYMVVGAPVGLYRIDFGNMQKEQEVTNTVSSGYSFAVDNVAIAHTIYDRPRIITTDRRGQFTQVQCTITNVTAGNVATVPTFTTATFFLSVIMREPLWTPDVYAIEDREQPLNAQGQFSTRAPFF